MTTFKAKLRRIGNSQGVYIPKKVITGYNMGDVITLSLLLELGDIIKNVPKKKDEQVRTNTTNN